MKNLLSAIVLILLVGCASQQTITRQDLMHHHWVLASVDQNPVPGQQAARSQPDLEIGENLTVNGTTGCNRYRGQGLLEGNHFSVQQLATTRRACREPFNDIEQTLTSVLSSGAEIALTKETLTLKNDSHTLIFTLKDWL